MQFSWRLAHGMLFFAGGACCAEGFVCLQFQHGYERCHMAASFFCTWIPCDSSHFAGSPVVIVFILYSVYIILYIYMIYIYICIYNHTHMYIYISCDYSWVILRSLESTSAEAPSPSRHAAQADDSWAERLSRHYLSKAASVLCLWCALLQSNLPIETPSVHHYTGWTLGEGDGEREREIYYFFMFN